MKLDFLILRDLLIYNYKAESRKQQRMFFDIYENQAEEVAAIIKDAATEADNADDNKSDTSVALRKKVQNLNLKRRGTVVNDSI